MTSSVGHAPRKTSANSTVSNQELVSAKTSSVGHAPRKTSANSAVSNQELTEYRNLSRCLLCLERLSSACALVSCQHLFCADCLIAYALAYGSQRPPSTPFHLDDVSLKTAETAGSSDSDRMISWNSNLENYAGNSSMYSASTASNKSFQKQRSKRSNVEIREALPRGSEPHHENKDDIVNRLWGTKDCSVEQTTFEEGGNGNNHSNSQVVSSSAGSIKDVYVPCPTCRVISHLSISELIEDQATLASQSTDIRLRIRKISRTSDLHRTCDVCSLSRAEGEQGGGGGGGMVVGVEGGGKEEANYYCSKCSVDMCSDCRLVHDSQALFKGHNVIHVSNKETFELHCDVHNKMSCTYFCLDCRMPACVICILNNHPSPHRTAKLRDAITIRRDHLKTLLNILGPHLDRLDLIVDRLREMVEHWRGFIASSCITGGYTGGTSNPAARGFNRGTSYSGLTGSSLVKAARLEGYSRTLEERCENEKCSEEDIMSEKKESVTSSSEPGLKRCETCPSYSHWRSQPDGNETTVSNTTRQKPLAPQVGISVNQQEDGCIEQTPCLIDSRPKISLDLGRTQDDGVHIKTSTLTRNAILSKSLKRSTSILIGGLLRGLRLHTPASSDKHPIQEAGWQSKRRFTRARQAAGAVGGAVGRRGCVSDGKEEGSLPRGLVQRKESSECGASYDDQGSSIWSRDYYWGITSGDGQFDLRDNRSYSHSAGTSCVTESCYASKQHQTSSEQLRLALLPRSPPDGASIVKPLPPSSSCSSFDGIPSTPSPTLSTPTLPGFCPSDGSVKSGECRRGEEGGKLEGSGKEAMYNWVQVQVVRHRRLFALSTKALELSESKKLFAIYEDLVDRIQTVLDFELFDIHQTIETLIEREEEEKLCTHRGGSVSLLSTENSLGVGLTTWGEGGAERWAREEGGGLCCNEAMKCVRVIDSQAASKMSAKSFTTSHVTSMSPLVRPKLIWKVEKQRSDIGEMWNPCDVAFLPDEMIVVAEYDNLNDRNNRLQIFDHTGKSIQVIAQGSIQPLGVALTLNGHLAVTDCKGKRVKVLTASGQTVIDIGKGQFGWPYGIAVNSRGQIIVTDAFNDTVSIYTIDGRRVKIFGSSGSQPSQFRNPYHVTVDKMDNIIVSDSGNNCVKAFDLSSGRLLFHAAESNRRMSIIDGSAGGSIGSADRKRRTLKGPRGITVDPSGNILVADDCCRVAMFDKCGTYVRNLLCEEDSIKYPDAVRCSERGHLAVTEWNVNNMCAVKLFNMYE